MVEHLVKVCPCPTCKSSRGSLHWLAFNAEGLVVKAKDELFPFEEVETRTVNAFSDDVKRRIDAHVKLLTNKLKLGGDSALTTAKLRDALKRSQELSAQLATAIATSAIPYAQFIADAGAQAGLGQLPDGSYDFAATAGKYSQQVRDAAGRASERMAQSVSRTVADKIGTVMQSSIEENLTMRQTAEMLQETIGSKMTGDRAIMIARTESSRAFTDGQIASWEASGVVTGKYWMISPRACEFCRAAYEEFGQKSVGLNEPFYALGHTLQVGEKTMTLDFDSTSGPPLHPNCRCTIMAEVSEE